jgi:tol-pal system protein YbgF
MMKRQLALLFAGLAFAGQALALFDDDEARRRIELLRQQLETQNHSIEERLTKIEQLAGDRSALLEFSSQMELLRSDIASMRGQVEQIANQAETLNKRQTDLYQDIDTRLRKLEQAREAAGPTDKPPAVVAEPEVSAAETRAYQAALDQFKLGNYALAVAAMQGFLVTYPSSALAPNAQYWIGMAYSGQRDYKSAIGAQRKLLAAWPESQKAPDAMLSIASAQETMGDRKSAQKTLGELITKYPQSSAATSAKQRLAASAKR